MGSPSVGIGIGRWEVQKQKEEGEHGDRGMALNYLEGFFFWLEKHSSGGLPWLVLRGEGS